MNMMMRYSNNNSNKPALFTAWQWQELEHQALVFKYMASGIPVPPDLLRRTTSSPIIGWRFEMGSTGKKNEDPEPGRCRRTDGKKWRCSKDAFPPHSKYCQRHMHRGTTTKNLRTATTIKPNYFRPSPPPSQLNTKDIINVRSTAAMTTSVHNESSSSSKLTMASLMSQTKHDDVNNNNNTCSSSGKTHHNFLEGWLEEDDGRRRTTTTTTQLSISINPNSSSSMSMHDFFQINKT